MLQLEATAEKEEYLLRNVERKDQGKTVLIGSSTCQISARYSKYEQLSAAPYQLSEEFPVI